MVYLTLSEFDLQIQSELRNLTSNDNPDTANDTVIEECIDLAESVLDSYIGISYNVSEIRAYVLLPTYKELKDFLSRITFVIARYYLYSRKNALVSESIVEKEYEMAIETLKGIRDREIKLPGVSLYPNSNTYVSNRDDYVLNQKGFKEFGNYENY